MTNGEDLNVPELLHTLDQETKFWSVGFEKHPHFEAIRNIGEAALKPLFDTIEDPDGPSWAHLQLIWQIAAEMDNPVEFEATERGKHVPVVATTIKWGKANGYFETE